jgi:hypothetical protein
MLESAIIRRYQLADEVLKDLNPHTSPKATAKAQTPVTQAKPVAKSPPSGPFSVTTSGSKIDQELAELRSQFLGGATRKSDIDLELERMKAQPPSSATRKSDIDLELEQLKAQFLSSDPSQNSTGL